jgi:hypothetical protein
VLACNNCSPTVVVTEICEHVSWLVVFVFRGHCTGLTSAVSRVFSTPNDALCVVETLLGLPDSFSSLNNSPVNL